MNLPPVAAFFYTAYYREDRHLLLLNNVFRFLMQFVFLAQNIFYIIAFDFIFWNLSLEGLCKTTSDTYLNGKNKLNLRLLYKSARFVPLFKIGCQRRPWRVIIMLVLFYGQAMIMRFLETFYALVFESNSYGNLEDRKTFYDPYFWLGWLIITSALTYPLVFIWLLWPFGAPVCEHDRCRWLNLE